MIGRVGLGCCLSGAGLKDFSRKISYLFLVELSAQSVPKSVGSEISFLTLVDGFNQKICR